MFNLALFLTFLIALLFPSCAPIEIRGDYLQKGFDYTNLGYTSLPETPSLYEIVGIEKLTIHIVSDRKDFDWKKARNKETGLAAYATTNDKISILGKKLGGKIIVNQFILGHEFKHILNFNDPDIIISYLTCQYYI